MIKAKLFVLGTQRELLSTDLEYYRTRGATTGRPGPIPMGGLVTLAFTSGYGDDRLLYALLHSPEGELCTLTTAKIVFYAGDPDGVVLFEYRLKDAAFIYWKEEFNAAGEAPMTVTLAISAAIQEIKGVTWVKPWRESEVPSEESVVRKEGAQREVLGDRGKKEDNALGGVVLEAAKGVILGNVDDFIASQTSRLNKKLGTKIGKGELPFPKGRYGLDQATGSIKTTLKNPSQTSGVIPKSSIRGGYDLIHIYSNKSKNTVSLRVLGNGKYEFDTLISGKSSKF